LAGIALGRKADAPSPVALDCLSPRELQVAALVARGVSSKSIARALGISDLTVRKHRENLLRKLNMSSASQLALSWGGATARSDVAAPVNTASEP
jgi:DNA-binding NarL/FixJ family response regulator